MKNYTYIPCPKCNSKNTDYSKFNINGDKYICLDCGHEFKTSDLDVVVKYGR